MEEFELEMLQAARFLSVDPRMTAALPDPCREHTHTSLPPSLLPPTPSLSHALFSLSLSLYPLSSLSPCSTRTLSLPIQTDRQQKIETQCFRKHSALETLCFRKHCALENTSEEGWTAGEAFICPPLSGLVLWQSLAARPEGSKPGPGPYRSALPVWLSLTQASASMIAFTHPVYVRSRSRGRLWLNGFYFPKGLQPV